LYLTPALPEVSEAQQVLNLRFPLPAGVQQRRLSLSSGVDLQHLAATGGHLHAGPAAGRRREAGLIDGGGIGHGIARLGAACMPFTMAASRAMTAPDVTRLVTLRLPESTTWAFRITAP
jgi:hypothetical protein